MSESEFLRKLRKVHGVGDEQVTPIDPSKGAPPIKDFISPDRNRTSRLYARLEGIARGRSCVHLVDVLKRIEQAHAIRWVNALKAMDKDRQNDHLDAFEGLAGPAFQRQRDELADKITLYLNGKKELDETHLTQLEAMARQARGV